ncbi:MAG: hypothetical protein MJ002_06990 [Paludibacteraceae bacterium]|nr:hypothetical protein [Paludibacteraceae bacterium]
MIKNIGKKDMVWGVFATVLKIGAGVLLYPFVLHKLDGEQIGIWTIFTTIQMLMIIVDFGFSDSFTRNVGYVFSGVKRLKKEGYEHLEESVADDEVDWMLLRNVIRCMKRFYGIMALSLFVLLATVGTWYVSTLVEKYSGEPSDVWIAWCLLVIFMTWNLYSTYYQSLLQGRGLMAEYNKIVTASYLTYLFGAIIFVSMGYGLVAVVGAQFLSIIVLRVLSKIVFFTKNVRKRLKGAKDGGASQPREEILKAIAPNAVKIGLTGLGGIIINRSSTFIGSEFLSLAEMAMFGITLQLIVVIGRASTVVTRVYLPKLFEWRVTENISKIRKTFVISTVVIIAGYVAGGVLTDLFGNWALVEVLGSNTKLLTGGVFWVIILQNFLETNHVNAADFLLSKNEVPFFKASLISAAATLVLLVVLVVWLDFGLWGMVLAPTIAQAAYQNWKWPSVVIRELWG